jgi:hypothetical protein
MLALTELNNPLLGWAIAIPLIALGIWWNGGVGHRGNH